MCVCQECVYIQYLYIPVSLCKCTHVCVFGCVWVGVCVRMRDRCVGVRLHNNLCVCVCVCERESVSDVSVSVCVCV